MGNQIKVALFGESWFVQTTETKGFDSFSVGYYETGEIYLRKALATDEFQFTHIPCHMIGQEFPQSVEELREKFDVIIISDVGANTFLLPVETFLHCNSTPNKLEMIKQYVLQGGGLCMVGGYLSFMGIEGKGKYYQSPVEDVLPVSFLPCDDRQEHPEGVDVSVIQADHPVFAGVQPSFHGVLGYNRAVAKPGYDVLAVCKGDPFLCVGEFGEGRSIAYATDCAPHWSSAEFSSSDEFKMIWRNMVRWLAKHI